MFGIDDVVMGGLVSGGLNLLGGVFGNESSARQADINRQFQSDMSGTAHQREVDDLRKAGLNPILSARGSGASTPSGSAAAQVNPVGHSFDNAVSSALAVRKQKAEIDLINSQNDKVKAETDVTAQNSAFLPMKFMADLDLLDAQTINARHSALQSASQANVNTQIFNKVFGEVGKLKVDTDTARLMYEMMKTKMPGMKLEEDVYSGKAGEFLKYMQLLFGSGSAGSLIRSLK